MGPRGAVSRPVGEDIRRWNRSPRGPGSREVLSGSASLCHESGLRPGVEGRGGDTEAVGLLRTRVGLGAWARFTREASSRMGPIAPLSVRDSSFPGSLGTWKKRTEISLAPRRWVGHLGELWVERAERTPSLPPRAIYEPSDATPTFALFLNRAGPLFPPLDPSSIWSR